jgi:hypothetical protein
MEGEVRYEIDRGELSDFMTRQIRLVESLRLETVGEYVDGLEEAEREAVWLAAGIATFIGQAIVDEPERFIVAAQERCTA